jgi:hypothetical protein
MSDYLEIITDNLGKFTKYYRDFHLASTSPTCLNPIRRLSNTWVESDRQWSYKLSAHLTLGKP